MTKKKILVDKSYLSSLELDRANLASLETTHNELRAQIEKYQAAEKAREGPYYQMQYVGGPLGEMHTERIAIAGSGGHFMIGQTCVTSHRLLWQVVAMQPGIMRFGNPNIEEDVRAGVAVQIHEHGLHIL